MNKYLIFIKTAFQSVLLVFGMDSFRLSNVKDKLTY